MKKQIFMFGLILALFSMFTACTKQASLTTELDEVAQLSAKERGSGDVHVSISDLPAKAQTTIAQRYPNASVLCVEKKAEGFYEVHLSNRLELKFTLSGNLFDVDADDDNKHIAIVNLSQNILNYISSNYSTAKILCAEYEEKDDVQTGNIEVYLDNGLELKFNSSGSLIDIDNSNTDDSGNDGGGDDGTPDQGGDNDDDNDDNDDNDDDDDDDDDDN